MKIHYAGALTWYGAHNSKTMILAGWAACCTGTRAETVRVRGNHSYHPADVTCATCKSLMAKAAATPS